MMDNKQLAEELILRFAGYPQPVRSMVQEAAKRLLQLVPDHPVKAGGMEADALRQLAAEWPLKENPWLDPDWTNEDYLRCVCISAADRIEQMAETIDYARTINAENTRLTAELAKVEAERDALKIDKLNLTAMVEQLENSYGQLQEINDRTFQSNQAMGEDLKVMKAERDAAIDAIYKIAERGTTWMCPYCKNAKSIYWNTCDCALEVGVCRTPFTKFEWRGEKLEDSYYG